MRSLLLGLCLGLLLAGGCYAPLPYEFADGGTVGDAALAACNTITDQNSCEQRSDCRVAKCDTCDPKKPTVYCLAKSEPDPVCPVYDCQPLCSEYTTMADCKAHAAEGCTPFDCCGFAGCLGPNEGQPQCAADCAPCAGFNESDCAAASYCHRVYAECQFDAPCAPTFSFCGYSQASCALNTLTCKRTPPVCAKGQVPAVVDGCYEGCVVQDDCCGQSCTGDQKCDLCWTDYVCMSPQVAC